MPESALIVRVPEAEPLVADLRRVHDPSAAAGVPAHITLLVPFKEPGAISTADLQTLERLFARHAVFAFELVGIGRWPGTTYLRPEPGARFVALTQAIEAAYPGCRPYGGRHAAVVPHLTVADGSSREAAAAEAALAARWPPARPLRCVCRQVELIAQTNGLWDTVQVFALGP